MFYRLTAALCVAMGCFGCNLTPTTGTLNFGPVYVGQSAPLTNTWVNNTNGPIPLDGFLPDGTGFRLTAPTSFTTVNIAAGATTPTATITFAPTAAQPYTGDVVALVPQPHTAVAARLTGVGVWQKLSGTGFGVSGGDFTLNQPLDFGTQQPGAVVTKQFRLTNGNAQALTLTGQLLVGGQGFAITAPAGGNVQIPAATATTPFQRVNITITFTAPQANGDYQDVVEFTDATGAYRFGIVVKGRVHKE